MAKEISVKRFAELLEKGKFKEIGDSILIIDLIPKQKSL